MKIDWTQRPAIIADIDLYTYVWTEEAHWETGRRAAVNLLRGVVPEHGIVEVCKGRFFNANAHDFAKAVSDLATLWLLANPGGSKPPTTTPEPQAAPADSPWVPSSPAIWSSRLKSNKELSEFRKQHKYMFRNPSPRRLEIHAAKWAAYWAARDRAGFEALDGDPQSVADDPAVQDEVIAGAMQRMAESREEKRRQKQ